MVPKLLEILDFRSNNEHYQPVIEALNLIERYVGKQGSPKDVMLAFANCNRR